MKCHVKSYFLPEITIRGEVLKMYDVCAAIYYRKVIDLGVKVIEISEIYGKVYNKAILLIT